MRYALVQMHFKTIVAASLGAKQFERLQSTQDEGMVEEGEDIRRLSTTPALR